MKKKVYAGEDPVDFDEDIAGLFVRIEPGEGDEFAAVKPWIGAIKEPESHPPFDPSPPDEDYKIDYVFGYRTEESRMNLHVNKNGQLVYPTAAIGIIHDFNENKQIYFGGGKTKFSARKQADETKEVHTDDITALAVSDSKELVASGQNGLTPIIFVWKADTAVLVKKIKLPKGSRLVTAIGISANDKYVCATDASEQICAHILEIKTGKHLDTIKINYVVKHLHWHPTDEDVFATCGADHFFMCHYNPMKRTTKKDRVQVKGGKLSFLSIAWSQSNPENVFVAGSDGNVHYMKSGGFFDKVSISADKKGCAQSVLCKPDFRADAGGKGDLVFASDNQDTLIVFHFDGKFNKIMQFTTSAPARAMDLITSGKDTGTLILGLKNGNIEGLEIK